MRLRIKGVIPLLIALALIVAIAGAMIHRVRYEDLQDQKAWEEVLEADRETAARAVKALPLVDEYERLTADGGASSPASEEVASEILDLFPEFRAPDARQGASMIPCDRMRAVLNGYARRARSGPGGSRVHGQR